ncbi:MAG: ABC transporter related protein [candidate division TM6 bacterium GW2011_GWE2_36_25]|nr:MAG: ABC transporter related protein [candidate division TM6 bacterium GW2011_GWF2_36_131]KKQ03860.1 MAG: ABC transporter related protein [candidate division TM6 bacterium GW2011_GWE2_36_25]KKQ19431.1 MAG: ABC transporter related protein [candidate division TM6 bacterium GW2011_GWA2_36_9]
MENSLIIENVSFKFSKEKSFFFKDVSLRFSMSALHYIVGDNGSGKSTLLRLILNQLSPGELLEGTIHRKGLIHLVAQNYNQMVAPSFSFEKNISFAKFGKYPRLSPLSNMQMMPHFVEKFNIALNRPVDSFSGGQKQIVAILMALQKPIDILLLDEPTAALDKDNTSLLLNFLNDLVQEMNVTVIMICHQQSHIKRCGKSSCVYLNVDKDNELRSVKQYELCDS